MPLVRRGGGAPRGGVPRRRTAGGGASHPSHPSLDRTHRLLRLALLLFLAAILALYLSDYQQSDIESALSEKKAETKRREMEREWADAVNIERFGEGGRVGRPRSSVGGGGGGPRGGAGGRPARERIMGLHPGQMRPPHLDARQSLPAGEQSSPSLGLPSPSSAAVAVDGARPGDGDGDGNADDGSQSKEEEEEELTDAALDEQEREFGVRHKRTKEVMPHAAIDHHHPHDDDDDKDTIASGEGEGKSHGGSDDDDDETEGGRAAAAAEHRSENRTSHHHGKERGHYHSGHHNGTALATERRPRSGRSNDDGDHAVKAETADANDGTMLRRPRYLFWLHIQKTGTSLFTALYLHFCPRILAAHPDLATRSEKPMIEYDLVKDYPHKEYCHPDGMTENNAEEEGGVQTKDGGDGAAGGVKFYHMPIVGFHHPYTSPRLSKSTLKPQQFDTFAMFRDPLERLRSAYSFRSHSALHVPHYSKLGDPNITFARYVSERHIPNCQSKMLLGYKCHEDVPPSALNLTLAVERISRDDFYFGFTDRWAESLCLFHAVYGGRVRRYELVNNRPSKRVEGNGGEALSEGGWRDADCDLVERAAAIFEGRLERAGCVGYEFVDPDGSKRQKRTKTKTMRVVNSTHATE